MRASLLTAAVCAAASLGCPSAHDPPDFGADGGAGGGPDADPGCTDDCPEGAFDWRDGIMYFAMIDRFYDGDPANNDPLAGLAEASNYQGGDLEGVRQKIEEGYFDDLGVNVLWLTAPVDNADGSGVGIGDDDHVYSAYHGYWPRDVTAVESRIGTLDDLRAVIDAAHARGIKVVLDYVMNHVHEESPVYAEHPEWFWPLDGCVCGEGCSWDDPAERTRCWFTPYLPDFDFTDPDARAFSVDNAVAWARDLGIDGYRLDAVKHIETAWIEDVRARLRSEVERDTVFYLVGETFSGDRGLIASYVDPAAMLDGQFDFPLRAQIARTILRRDATMTELAEFLDDNDGFYGPGAVMGTFLGNHDVPRAIHLAEDTPLFGEWDDGKDRGWENLPEPPAGPESFERVFVAYALLMTTPGVPLIYYGDEIGMAGGGDPDNRRFMRWDGLTADQQWLRDRVAALTALRAEHPALRRGARETLGSSNDVLVYAMDDGAERLIVALNRGDAASNAPGVAEGSYVDLLTGDTVTAPVAVPARSARVLQPVGDR